MTTHLLPGSTVGYDVLVFVGLERFLSHRQREEIREALVEEYAVKLSTGEVSHLTKRFLQYLETLHEERIGKIRQALCADGGYPLHVDATGEDGQGTLLVAFAGWRRWLLDAWKIPTERKEVILPALRSVTNRFGAPCAVMRDLGKAMIPAVNDFVGELDNEIPVLSCHSHFLADVGKDLLDGSHGELRALFRRFKVRPNLGLLARELGRKIGVDIAEARQEVRNWQEQIEERHTVPSGRAGLATVRSLAQWVLDFKADGTDFGFPFDRPYLDLYDRCITARRATDGFLRTMPADNQVQRALKRLARFLEPVVCDKAFKEVAARLRKRTELFDELRDALRITPKSGGRNPTPTQHSLDLEEALAELRNVQVALENFVASLGERRPERGPAQDMREAIDIILEHIEIHGESLFGHVVCLPTPDGELVIRIVDRTNNVLESEFGVLKQGERRRSGRKILTQDFERLPAAAALTCNLTRPDYVKLLCGSLDALPQAFAELDAARRITTLAGHPCTPLGRSEDPIPEIASAALPAADRPLIRSKDMRRRVFAAAKSRAPKTPAKRNFGCATTAN